MYSLSLLLLNSVIKETGLTLSDIHQTDMMSGIFLWRSRRMARSFSIVVTWITIRTVLRIIL